MFSNINGRKMKPFKILCVVVFVLELGACSNKKTHEPTLQLSKEMKGIIEADIPKAEEPQAMTQHREKSRVTKSKWEGLRSFFCF